VVTETIHPRLEPVRRGAAGHAVAEVVRARQVSHQQVESVVLLRVSGDGLEVDLWRFVAAQEIANQRAAHSGMAWALCATERTSRRSSGRVCSLCYRTRRWLVLRELDQSQPYVTPATHAALEEIGRCFHSRLQERGLPPFRFEVTSVLRTAQQQADLRRRNRNASATTNSHEFGTTIDLAYHRSAAPEQLEQWPWQQAVQGEAGAGGTRTSDDDATAQTGTRHPSIRWTRAWVHSQ
jgi:hypothetical protein